jgi:hypothetical protein
MTSRRQAKGPQFITYFTPVIETLKELGGSGRPSEVKDLIATKLRLSEALCVYNVLDTNCL